jgi:hypothetical protein
MVKQGPRRRTFVFGAFVVLMLLAVALVVPPAPREVVQTAPADSRVAKGAIHIHTTQSDGGGSLDEVASAAARAGLRFAVTTDHGDGRDLPPATYRPGVLCIAGAEISTDGGHLVALGFRPPEYRLAGEARDVIDDVHRLGGIAIAAHPVSPRAELAWHDWEARFDGFEWLNADTEWRDESPLTLARLLAGYPLRPSGAVAGSFDRPREALARFDSIAATRALVAIAGHDAHARIGRRRGDSYEAGRLSLPLPSYHAMFRSFAVRAMLDADLTGDAETDAAAIVRAIRHGRIYTAIDAVAQPSRVSFTAESGSATAIVGERLIPAGPLIFRVDADGPADAMLVLIHEGKELASGPPPLLRRELPPTPGAYRAEVRIPGAPGDPPIPWVVTSTIHVGIPSAGTPAAPTPPLVPALPVAVSTGPWRIEHAPASLATAFSAGSDLTQFTYRLDTIASGSPYAALVWPMQIPAAATAIQFTAQADRPMRVSVQLRMPGGSGGLRWRRSVYIDTVERALTIELDDFRPVEGGTRREPDISRIDSILFVVDTVNTDPGGAGWIRVGKVVVG